ncbi:MAG: FAD:protein FMN transferase [Candidatus Competibacter sp.]|nr:FAD:protein FMN transferase [Candidatus Competibacter sp.]
MALSRRRFITLAAVAAGVSLVAGLTRTRPMPVRWQGTALGAPASIQLYATDENQARSALRAASAELARLEAVLSLYRSDSALATLNRAGRLDNAPPDLIAVVERALELARISDGVYDPTIQPVWQLYYQHFLAERPDPAGPPAGVLAAALSRVDWRAVELDPTARRIAFSRPGMALTLNSGAQGYITDRVTEVLRVRGFERMLVDMGEPRALAAKPDGTAWRIGIANPADPGHSVATLEVVDQAVATSGGYGTLFDPAGSFTHLIDPRTGRTAPALLGVSVVADAASQADGLATAMLLAAPERRQAILRAGGGRQALYVTPQGVVETVHA